LVEVVSRTPESRRGKLSTANSGDQSLDREALERSGARDWNKVTVHGERGAVQLQGAHAPSRAGCGAWPQPWSRAKRDDDIVFEHSLVRRGPNDAREGACAPQKLFYTLRPNFFSSSPNEI